MTLRNCSTALSSSNFFLLNEVISHIRQKNGKMMRPMLLLFMASFRMAGSILVPYAAVSLNSLHNGQFGP